MRGRWRRALETGLFGVLALGLLLEEGSGARPGLAAVGGSTWSAVEASPRVAQARRRRPAANRGRKKPPPAPAPEPAPEPAPAPDATTGGGGEVPVGLAGTSKVEFEGLQIKGQTTKAGEVQILERKETGLKSMVKRRTSYREEIIQTVFPEQAQNL